MTLRAVPRTISEADLQLRIIMLARHCGWTLVHMRAVNQHGRWSVPYEGDPGLPDLILARNGVVILAELKSQLGKATPAQKAWLEAAGDHGRVWRPSNWPEIVAELTAKDAA